MHIIKLYTFVTAALDGDGWPASILTRLPQWKYFLAFSVSLVSGSKDHDCYPYRDSKSSQVDKTLKYSRSHGGC